MKVNKLKNNPCSFTSKIVFVDCNTFNKLLKTKEGYSSSENIVKGKNIYSMGIDWCIGGGSGIKGIEGCCFHHANPSSKELTDIYENIKNLETTHKTKPSILITGGRFPWNISKLSFENVLNKLQEFKENTTIIWGQKDWERTYEGWTNIHYSAPDDTWTIYHHKPKKNDKFRWEGITSLKDLKNTYEIIQISKNDELWIGNKRIYI